MELVVNKELYQLYASSYFDKVMPELSVYLDKGIIEVCKFFELEHINKLKIYLYDNAAEYQRLFKAPYPPNGIAGCFGYENVKVYADLNKIDKHRLFTCILHELTHVIYRNYIQEKGINNRIVWFDEGLASLLSGEKNTLLDNDRLKEFIENKISGEDKEIPKISYLHKHGASYGEFVDTKTKKYNGYDWSYLMIRYLIETLSKKEFNKLMRSKQSILDIEGTITNDTYNYFTKKVKTK